MRATVVTGSELEFAEAETCLVVPFYQKEFPLNSDSLTDDDEMVFQALADKEVLTGKTEECYFLPTPSGRYKAVMALGLGARDRFTPEVLRRGAGAACKILQANRCTHVYLDAAHLPELPVPAFLEGIVLGQYDFDAYRPPKEDEPLPVRVTDLFVIAGEERAGEELEEECKIAVLAALSTNGARHLANTPPNEMTPTALAAFAQGIADQSGCECTVLEQRQLEVLGLNALLAVGRGSTQSPCLIVLRRHHGDDVPTVAIVGKGVTFDTGGISIKPAQAMHEMKYDMCGAAAVLCAMMSIVELKPAINVVCVVPAVENMPGGNAMRPGDIIQAYNGKHIEVLNTDAEGRLILADALAYTADKYKPDVMVDLATLTGACVIALGHYAAGLFGNDETLIEQLREAGEASGDRLWPLPLWDDYDRLIETAHAQVANVGPREGGAISAAAFLKHFVGDTPWAHLDIAGTAWGGKHISYLNTDHATGFGVRLLTQWILRLARESR